MSAAPLPHDVAETPSLAPILAVHFLGTLGFSLAIPFLVFIVTDLGGASWTYGLLGATYSGFQLVGAPLLGRWSDRVGRRRVLVVTQLGTFTAWMLFFFALSLPVGDPLFEVWGAPFVIPLLFVFLARALDGATGGNISVANAYVADLTRDTPQARAMAFGKMGMAASLGFTVGPAAAGVLGTTSLGPRLPILVAAAFSLVTTVAIVAGLKTPPPCPEGAPSPSVTEAGLCQQAKPAKDAALTTEVAPLFKAPAVFRVVVACFAIFLAFNLFYAGFPLHAATAYGWDTGRLGLFFAMLSGFMIVAQGPVLRFVAQRFPPPVAFALGMASLAASMVLLAVPLPFFAAGFFALGNGLAWPTFQTRIAEVAPDQQGEVQGMTTSAGSMASILGLLLGGALYPGLGVGLFLGSGVVFFVVLSLTPLWFSSSEPPST